MNNYKIIISLQIGLLWFVNWSNSQYCSLEICVGENQPCTSDMHYGGELRDPFICSNEFSCQPNPNYIPPHVLPASVVVPTAGPVSGDNSTTNTSAPRLCAKMKKEGSNCTITLQCKVGLKCGSNSTCTPILGYAAFGEPCTFSNITDSECGPKLECSNTTKKCVPLLAPEDIDANHTCTSDLHCPVTQYCGFQAQNYTCVPRIPFNGLCTLFKSPSSINGGCVVDAICDPDHTGQGVCIQPFSKSLGENCSRFNQDLFDNLFISPCNVSSGLICGPHGKCVDVASITPPNNNTNCYNNSDACISDMDNQLCVCTSNTTGTCRFTDQLTKMAECRDASTAFFKCAIHSNCSLSSSLLSPKSCPLVNCAKEYCHSFDVCIVTGLPGLCPLQPNDRPSSHGICEILVGANSSSESPSTTSSSSTTSSTTSSPTTTTSSTTGNEPPNTSSSLSSSITIVILLSLSSLFY